MRLRNLKIRKMGFFFPVKKFRFFFLNFNYKEINIFQTFYIQFTLILLLFISLLLSDCISVIVFTGFAHQKEDKENNPNHSFEHNSGQTKQLN
jgi:hypothetical protein